MNWIKMWENLVYTFTSHKEYIALIFLVFGDYVAGFSLALKNHNLSSAINYKGTISKIVTLTLPLILYPVFFIFNFDDIFTVWVYSLLVPNIISLVENLHGLGLPFPEQILKYFDKTPPKK